MADKRVRVGVKYGDSHINMAGQNYTYLVRPEQANIGQILTVPVNNGHGIYYTKATVTSVTSDTTSKQIRNPRKAQ